jgi:DNA mismatch repair protein MutS
MNSEEKSASMHDSADQENLTPMMRQYRENKERHPDAILLFRMGDFYEMFFGDAHKASKILDITLTSRDRNKDNSTPMCGFPHHSASAYISRLLAAGERVAVCDQMEDPRKAKGLVKRAVTRVISPGLNDEPDLMRAEENHYLVAIGIKGSEIGIASLDLTVGEFSVTSSSDITQAIQEIKRLDPREALVSERLPEEHVIRRELDGLCILRNLDERFTDV